MKKKRFGQTKARPEGRSASPPLQRLQKADHDEDEMIQIEQEFFAGSQELNQGTQTCHT